MPQVVEPPQPPTNITISSNVEANPPQAEKLALA